jgi:hypothetical protein
MRSKGTAQSEIGILMVGVADDGYVPNCRDTPATGYPFLLRCQRVTAVKRGGAMQLISHE